MQSHDDVEMPPTPPGGFPVPSPTSSPQIDPIKASIAEAVHERRNEYIVQKKIKIKVGTWNVASIKGTEKDLKNWFVHEQEIADHLASLKLEKGDESDREDKAESKEDNGQQTGEKESGEEEHTAADTQKQEIGLYVLGLQEIVDISSPAQLLNPYVDLAPAQRWKQAVEEALPLGYQPVAEQQLVGLYVLIYASPLVNPNISDVSTVHIATGGLGYTGNKGAVAVRLVLGGITKMLFVNSHLSAGNEKANLERRNWDVSQILSRARFSAVENELDPTKGRAETIGDEDFAVWFGDLNFRLEGIPGDDVRRLLMLHTKGEYSQQQELASDVKDLAYGESHLEQDESSNASEHTSSSITLVDKDENDGASALAKKSVVQREQPDNHNDPTSLQSTLKSLLSHDQLRKQIENHKAFHDGWEEGDITFLPTYKYDIGTLDIFDSSEKMRAPSWCDRILFRCCRRRQEIEKQRLASEVRTPLYEGPQSGIIFDYDPENDAEDAPATPSQPNDHDIHVTHDIKLETYSSHQDITSSDHKPLAATFTACYSAEDTKRKSSVYWKVAKAFDTAENEDRPRITVVSSPIQLTEDRTVDFGNVKFGTHHTNELSIANTGTKIAKLQIVKQGRYDPPEWLRFDVWDGGKSLQIGDVATIRMDIFVSESSVGHRLDEGNRGLEYILVLRIEGGADLFVAIRATWVA